MSFGDKINPNPVVFAEHDTATLRADAAAPSTPLFFQSPPLFEPVMQAGLVGLDGWEEEEEVKETSEATPLDRVEVFELLRHIQDPEHPLTLEQLNVLRLDLIKLEGNHLTVDFTPTIPHCSLATLIGLCIRVQLLRVLPARFKVDVRITPGTHVSELAVNKQLADKERVAAALENARLSALVNNCLATAVP